MGKRSFFALALLAILIFLIVPLVGAKDVTVEARLNPSSFAVNEGARLSIVVNGVRKNADFEVPEIANIKLHRRGQSSQTSFVNGKMSSSITYNFIMQAFAPGKYTIPAIEVRAGGENVMTNAVSFEVTADGNQNAPGPSEGKSVKDIAFITVSEIGDHFPGEIVPITLKAYFSRNYRVDLNSLPTLKGDGVLMPQLASKPEQVQESVGGQAFHVLIWKTSLSGIKTGTHPIQFSLDATVLIPQERRSRSPFSSFGGSMFDDSVFDSFFGNVQRKPITAISPELQFNVKALPEKGKPQNFTGAIGNFTMDVGAPPRRVEVGEPITLSMTISGEGNFNRVEAPIFPETSSWKTYSPTSDYGADSDNYRGKKSFEQAIVVKQQGVTAIPSLSFSYFDPAKKEYVTLESEPIPLELIAGIKNQTTAVLPAKPAVSSVSPADVAPATQPVEKQSVAENAPLFANLAPIHLETGSLTSTIMPLFQRIWFIALCFLCVLLIVALLYLNWQQHREIRRPDLVLQKKRSHQLLEDLKAVEQARDHGDAAVFLAQCRIAIQNHVGASRLETAASMSLTDLTAELEGDSPLVGIFARAEDAAYAGASLTTAEMTDYFEQLKTELEKLS